MEKRKILSKLNIDIKDYNNELEKILENKLFSYDVKNLLLSMLYKIENAYRDYQTVKLEVPSKRDFIENVLRIIKEKCIKIILVKSGTPEGEELEKNNLKYTVDKANGEIVCFQNELVMLTALFKLDEVDVKFELAYEYAEEPLNILMNSGKIDSDVEVIRDFNGWSWDTVTRDIQDIDYNCVYQVMLLLNGQNYIYSRKNKKIFSNVCKIAVQKMLADKKYLKKLQEIKKEKKQRLELFEDKKKLLDKITEEKKEYSAAIEKIDRILNNKELLKKEYYARNEKLPNKQKIFSASYLVGILHEEREELLSKIDECNRVIMPKEFIEFKAKLQKENEFLDSALKGLQKEDLLEIFEEFLDAVGNIINKLSIEETNKLIEWIYKIRYFRFIPINSEQKIKDLEELNPRFEKIIKLIIKKSQEFKVWDNFTENQELTYKILKEIFDIKIIYLQNIVFQCKYEDKVLYVEIYDDTVIENTLKIEIDNVRIKKKFKLFS